MKIYYTETKADYDELMAKLEKQGYEWMSGEKPTESNMWLYLESDSTLKVDPSDKSISMVGMDDARKRYPDALTVTYTAKKESTSEQDKLYADMAAAFAHGFYELPTMDNSHDMVNKPKHYVGVQNLEVETVLENFLPKITDGYVAHRIGSAIEYILRHPEKNGRQDLEKAKKNLEQIFSYLEETNK